MTWRRSVEAEMKKGGYGWHNLVQGAQDRVGWGRIVGGLCFTTE